MTTSVTTSETSLIWQAHQAEDALMQACDKKVLPEHEKASLTHSVSLWHRLDVEGRIRIQDRLDTLLGTKKVAH